MSELKISIILVNWNTCHLLDDCLSSVFTHLRHTISFEVIVIDNASSDGSAEMVARKFPEVQLIRNSENVGFARANNQGAAISKGEFLLLLNSDTIILDDGLAKIILYMTNHPEVGAATGRILNHDLTFQQPFNKFPHYIESFFHQTVHLIFKWKLPFGKFFFQKRIDELQPHKVDWVSGAYLFVRKEFIVNGKILDESIFMYYEDTLLCYNIRELGYYIIYLPYAPIIHYGGMSSKNVKPNSIYNSFRGSVQYFTKVKGNKIAKHYEDAVIITWKLFFVIFSVIKFFPLSKLKDKSELFSYLVKRHVTEINN